MSSISITFLRTALPGESVYFYFYGNYPNTSTSSLRGENFVTSRVNPGETSIGTVNAQAISYKFAFTTDYGSNFTTSISGDTVTITTINGSTIFNASTTDLSGNPLTPLVSFSNTPPITPIILEWKDAFDSDNNIAGYELSYKTNGAWIDLPFISSSATGGSYSFTPTQQIDHTFRIRIMDDFNYYSGYQYFLYPISASYQISSGNNTNVGSFPSITAGCQIPGDPQNTYSPIFLSSTPPAVGVTVYTDSGMTLHFIGHGYYWLIKTPSGLEYSCKISGNTSTQVSGGIIEEIYLCGNNSGLRSSVGTTVLNNTCSLIPTVNIYWSSVDSFVVDTILYTNSDCTSIFNGGGLFYMIQYTNVNELTLTMVVKVGTLGNIVSLVNKITACAITRPGGISDFQNYGLNATCTSTSTNPCYIVSADPINIATGDFVYTNSAATIPYTGNNNIYRIFISTSPTTLQAPTLCKIGNDGKVTSVTAYCSVSGGGSGGGGGGCPVPETLILLKNGNQIPAGDIKVGDMIYTLHETTFEPGEYEVSHAEIVYQDRLQITFDDESIIKVSDSHKFLMIDKSWKNSCKLVEGDIIKGLDIDKKIISIEKIGIGEVVKFEVIDAHTYISEGLISHNNKIYQGV